MTWVYWNVDLDFGGAGRWAVLDTNDTNSTATRHRHDTGRIYRGCATAWAASDIKRAGEL